MVLPISRPVVNRWVVSDLKTFNGSVVIKSDPVVLVLVLSSVRSLTSDPQILTLEVNR